MTEHSEFRGDEEGSVEISFIPAEEVPAKHRKGNKVFEPGSQAVIMTDGKAPNGPKLYFTAAEWEAFIEGVKDGEFDDMLDPDYNPETGTNPTAEQ
jgi:hypothetical protein